MNRASAMPTHDRLRTGARNRPRWGRSWRRANTVRIKVAGQTESQPLTVLRDPRSPGSDADIEQSVATLLRIRDDISRTSDTVNHIEWLRKQLEVIEGMLRPPKKAEANNTPPSSDSDDDDDPDVAPA